MLGPFLSAGCHCDDPREKSDLLFGDFAGFGAGWYVDVWALKSVVVGCTEEVEWGKLTLTLSVLLERSRGVLGPT